MTKRKRARPRTGSAANRKRRLDVKRLVAGTLLGALILLAAWQWLAAPMAVRGAGRTVAFTVPPRSGLLAIGGRLKRAGLVRSALAFALLGRVVRAQRIIRPGRFRLSTEQSLPELIGSLEAGGQPLFAGIRVTIPEGFTAQQIGSRLQQLGITRAEEFRAAVHNPASLGPMPPGLALPAGSLQGYLFPDTYRFKPETPAPEVARAMALNFWRRFGRPYQREIAQSQRPLAAIVTEASLIEREAKAPQDRAMIAGVIENRLKRHMPLDVDASVVYALGHYKPRVTFADLKVQSPYNTYRHAGLPPGPIANPGLPSLLAALRPEPSSYLYYVAAPDGTHVFTRTLAEHQAAIHKVALERQQLDRTRRAASGG